MELLPKCIEATLPRLREQEGKGGDAIVHVKLFTPWSYWTWYATEYDPDERLFFGLVCGQETELGHFSLDEIEQIRGPAGLRIERDINWKPKPFKEILDYRYKFGEASEGGDETV